MSTPEDIPNSHLLAPKPIARGPITVAGPHAIPGLSAVPTQQQFRGPNPAALVPNPAPARPTTTQASTVDTGHVVLWLLKQKEPDAGFAPLPEETKKKIGELLKAYKPQDGQAKMDKVTFITGLKELAGKDLLKHAMKMIASSSLGAQRKRPAQGVEPESALPPAKRSRAEGAQPGQGGGSSVADGYADAAAEAAAAGGGGADKGADKGGEDMRSQFDVLAQSGVDLAAEDAAMSAAEVMAEAARNESAAAQEAHKPFARWWNVPAAPV